jgi:hypothetical protein
VKAPEPRRGADDDRDARARGGRSWSVTSRPHSVTCRLPGQPGGRHDGDESKDANG